MLSPYLLQLPHYILHIPVSQGNDIDHLFTMHCYSGKTWVLTLMQMLLWDIRPHLNIVAHQLHHLMAKAPPQQVNTPQHTAKTAQESLMPWSDDLASPQTPTWSGIKRICWNKPNLPNLPWTHMTESIFCQSPGARISFFVSMTNGW